MTGLIGVILSTGVIHNAEAMHDAVITGNVEVTVSEDPVRPPN